MNAKKRRILIWCAAQSELDQLKIKTDQIDEKAYFGKNEPGKTFVVSVIEKLKSRLLVGSSFLHKTTCLDPSSLSILGKDVVLLHFRQLVQQLSQQKIIACHLGDTSLSDFEQLISKEINIVMFNDYDSSTQRLDSFFFQKVECAAVWFSFSCHQVYYQSFSWPSQVERGFSINKALMNDNM